MNATRWSDFKLQGDRVFENAEFMCKYARDKKLGEDMYLNVGEQRMLAQLLAVLTPFYEVTQLFQGTDEVSLSHVYPCILKLLDMMTIAKDCAFQVKAANGAFVETKASAFVQPVKDFMEYLFTSLTSRWLGSNRFFTPSANRNSGFILYGVATILDPRFCRNKYLSMAHRTYILDTALPSFFHTHQQEVLAYLKRKDPAAVASTVAKAAALSSFSLASSSSSSSAAAKGKVHVFTFEDDSSDEEDDGALLGAEGAAEGITLQLVMEQFEKERSVYAGLWAEVTNSAGEQVFRRAEGVPKNLGSQPLCPYDWWATKREVWPILSFLACLVLSIPASSADVERLFSQAGITMSDLRTSLDATRFHKIMVVQGNFSKTVQEG